MKSNPIKLSSIAEKKPVSTMPSAEKLEEFKKREQEEKENLEKIAEEYKKEIIAEESKTEVEVKPVESGKVVHPGLTGAGLTLGGRKPEPVEPPMPLEQWNQMIEEAEKEVSKEVKKPESDGFDEDEIKYELENKDTDSKKKTLSYIMRERNQQVKKEHQED